MINNDHTINRIFPFGIRLVTNKTKMIHIRRFICRKRRRGHKAMPTARMALTSRLSFIVIPPLESTPNVYCTHRKRKKAPHLPRKAGVALWMYFLGSAAGCPVWAL